MGIRSIVLALLMSLAWFAKGQNALETSFNNGKSMFNSGRYELAMEALKPAMAEDDSNVYRPYASFYYALSAYRAGFKPLARDMFTQIATNYPDWQYANECRYWITLIQFETGDFDAALTSGQRLDGTPLQRQVQTLQKKYLGAVDIKQLSSLYDQHPDNGILAEAILLKLEQMPFDSLDQSLVQRLSTDHQLVMEAQDIPAEPVFKPTYKVAVMFPFIWSNMETSGLFLRKTLVVQIYEGVRLAADELKEQGVDIELIVYDTQGDTAVTAALLAKPEMLGMDLIIGPLVPGPSALARAFSYEHKINMFNPVTNSSTATSGNPFAFMINPNESTIGVKAGEYVVETLENKNLLIYYSSRASDREMALAFRDVVEADSFNILGMNRVSRDSTERIFEYLTAKQDVLDSLGNEVLDENDEKMEELVIAKDSIGGIFVSTFDYKIATEVFSSVANRRDSIQVVGHGSWLLDKTANYQSMQDLGITMLAPDYVDYSGQKYLSMERKYIEEHHELPTRYVSAGYDCMLFLGHCLQNYGVYFQKALRTEVIKGVGLRQGYDFRDSNDNQYIPIIWFEDLGIQVKEPHD